MYEREENAQFSLISYSKERRFRAFQTLPDSWKNKKLLQVLTWFLKLVYYRDYLGKIWRNSKIHDCQPILENYRHWLLSLCKPCVMSVRGPNNVGRALQTDPTLLRYSSAITEQKKCWELLAEKFDRFQTLRNNTQPPPTTCNRVCKRTQHVISNNVASVFTQPKLFAWVEKTLYASLRLSAMTAWI